METQTTVARGDGQRAEAKSPERARVTPAMDIYESADEILLVADVPGVAREDISIALNKQRLTLTARRTAASLRPGARGVTEFDYYRAFVVPPGLDADRITAELTHGVLRVRLPKSGALRPRRIEVRAG